MTERFVRDQNISRFEALLETETDGEKRELLHGLLIEEEDRITSPLEHLQRLEVFIEHLAIVIGRQKRVIADLVAEGRDERRARLLLMQLNRTQSLFRYRRRLLDASAPSSPEAASPLGEKAVSRAFQIGGDGGNRTLTAKGQRILRRPERPSWTIWNGHAG